MIFSDLKISCISPQEGKEKTCMYKVKKYSLTKALKVKSPLKFSYARICYLTGWFWKLPVVLTN